MRYFATLGYTPSVLDDLDALVDRKPDVTVFHGDLNRAQKASNKEAVAKLRQTPLRYTLVEVPKPWDFRACFDAFCSSYRTAPDEDIIVNASGGTEVMNSAASVFGLLTGAECRYLNRKSGQTHVIDMFRLRLALHSPGNQRRIIDEAAKRGGQVPLADLPSSLRVTQGAVTQLVDQLVAFGLAVVEPRKDARGKQVSLATSLWPLIEVERNAPGSG